MGVAPIKPVKVDWFARVLNLSVSCIICFDDEQEEPIRKMWHLLRESPDELWTSGLTTADELYFEWLLAAHDWESAARSFLTAETALMLSRDDNGLNLATVVLPNGNQAEASADSPALALVGALASALVEGRSALFDLDAPPLQVRKAA